MNAMHDLIVRGGTIVDGSGRSTYEADIAIDQGKIVEIGKISSKGKEEIDARDKIVTPGFVDIHTHYDAQATWEHRIRPSSDHGVTTVVMGSCGVGFAPCRPEDRDLLIRLMEGVEDIPEVVMAEGLPWNWETYGEYLDSLGRRNFDIDIGSLIAHAPIRAYVMRQRGSDREPATSRDMSEMARIVAEGMRAGALGFSTSRSLLHRTKSGELAPTVTAGEEELLAIARAMSQFDSGIFQLIDDFHDTTEAHSTSFDQIRHLSKTGGRPIHFSLVELTSDAGKWRHLIRQVELANREGYDVKAQVFPRPMGGLLGFDMPYNPFCLNPSYVGIRHLDVEARINALRTPELRTKLVSEWPEPGHNPNLTRLFVTLDAMFPLGDPACYTPTEEDTIGARAKREGRDPREVAYDILLEQGGRAKLFVPIGNDGDKTYDDVFSLIEHPDTIIGLGDGGAHYGLLCDASYTTHLLSYWVRDRSRKKKFSIERAVQRITSEPAASIGLRDRGLIAPGYRADLNVIDLDRLRLHSPVPFSDLPAGGWRMHQKAEGYCANVVNGMVTYRDGEATGALPGRLVRGANYAKV